MQAWRNPYIVSFARAVADFKRVADLNPHNIDAAREVRLFNMRQTKDDPMGGAVPSSSASTSLLRRLLKK